jgi:polyketide synthase PksN/surfactin family lipopeptide synthetase A
VKEKHVDFVSINKKRHTLMQEGINSNTSIKEENNKDIAIIGISLKLPLAESVSEYWNNIKNKINCVGQLSGIRKEDYDKLIAHMHENIGDFKYLNCAYLEEIDKFDHNFFLISPKEAYLNW